MKDVELDSSIFVGPLRCQCIQPPVTPEPCRSRVSLGPPELSVICAGAVVGGVPAPPPSKTPPLPVPHRQATLLNLGWALKRCSSSSDYQRRWRATILLSPNSRRVNQTTKPMPTFDQTKTKLLPKLCIAFVDRPRPRSRIWSAHVSGDQPGLGREAPVLTRDWTVLRCLVKGWGGGGGTVKPSRQPESKNGRTTSALLWSNLRNACTFSAVTLTCFFSFGCLFLFIFGFLCSVPPFFFFFCFFFVLFF